MNKMKEKERFNKLNKSILLKLYIEMNNLDLNKSDAEILEILYNKLKEVNVFLDNWEDKSKIKEELKNHINEINKYSVKESDLSLINEEEYDDNKTNTILELILNEFEVKYMRDLVPRIKTELYILLLIILKIIETS